MEAVTKIASTTGRAFLTVHVILAMRSAAMQYTATQSMSVVLITATVIKSAVMMVLAKPTALVIPVIHYLAAAAIPSTIANRTTVHAAIFACTMAQVALIVFVTLDTLYQAMHVWP